MKRKSDWQFQISTADILSPLELLQMFLCRKPLTLPPLLSSQSSQPYHGTDQLYQMAPWPSQTLQPVDINTHL